MFTLVAVLTLALGIGANTAIFSLLSQVLFRSLPVRDPEKLVVLHAEGNAPGMSTSDNKETVFSYPMYRDLRDRNTVFAGVVARSGAPVNVAWAGQTERASADIVTGNFFDVLGVPAVLGRTLTPEDDRVRGGHPVTVLSYGYWTRRFGANAAILNQKVNINGHPMLVIGVTPRTFLGLVSGQAPDLFVPMAMKRAITPLWDGLDDRKMRWMNIFARLKPGMSEAQSQAGMSVVYRSILTEELAQFGPLRNKRAEEQFLAQKLEVRPAVQGVNQLRETWQKPLVALMAMVGLVLLIACANIATLMLTRAAGRRREIAVRLAVGAGRAAIARELVLESLVVSLAGGLAGLAVSHWTTLAMIRFLPGDSAGGWLSAQLDARLLGFSLVLAAVTGVVFGLVPAIQATRPDVATALRDQPRSVAGGGSHGRSRKILVAVQVALSLLLLCGAGLFSRSLWNLMSTDPGFRAERLMTFALDPRLAGYSTPRSLAFYRELRERLSALPGVTGVGCAFPGPLSGADRGGNITVEGYQAKEDEYTGASMNLAGPDYFRTLGVPLIAGREFTERDDAGAPKTVIVNEAFVKRYFAGGSPLGRHLAFGAGNRIVLDREIVGVVRNNQHSSLRAPVKPTIYYPYAQDNQVANLIFYVRTAADESDVATSIRRVVRDLDADMPVFRMQPMTVRVAETISTDRLIAFLSSAFGVLATILAAVGLYGVVAYTVSRRTPEIGIRMALGALPRNVLWLVMKDVALLVGAGIAVGLPAAIGLSRLAGSQLFGITPSDPLTLAAATALLALVAALSGYLPGRRATRIDPVIALRCE